MTPVALPLAAITVMLWIIWSDSLRRRTYSRAFYYARSVLFMAMVSVLLYNLVTFGRGYTLTEKGVVIAAAFIGLVGVGYFVKKASRRA